MNRTNYAAMTNAELLSHAHDYRVPPAALWAELLPRAAAALRPDAHDGMPDTYIVEHEDACAAPPSEWAAQEAEAAQDAAVQALRQRRGLRW